ncbi:2893_t:CDS:1, partial [Racocetra persica]
EKKEISSSSSILVKNYGDIYFNTQDTESAVKFFEKLGILSLIRFCTKCQKPMRKAKDHHRKDNQKWACTSKTACSYSTTLRSGTWLANSRLSLAQIAKIIFCWSYKLPQKFAVVEAE